MEFFLVDETLSYNCVKLKLFMMRKIKINLMIYFLKNFRFYSISWVGCGT